LGLLGGELTPTLQRRLARWATLLPFGQAATELADTTQVVVSDATARRLTEAAGASYVAVQTAAAERIAREAPAPSAGPPVQVVSVDGAMVPLVGGFWGEVKTLAIGTVVPDPADPDGVRTTDISYFSRRAEVEAFVQLALVETHRRGVETAGLVELLVDGGVWCQQMADHHRPDAVRVLDFGHAVGQLTTAAEATFGAKTAASQAWVAAQAHDLKHGEPIDVVAALANLPVEEAVDPRAAATARDATLGYLTARWEQIQYARFRAQGLPIGSGMVESGNKLVVEARLKGPGMHWAAGHIDPMVALRTALRSGRWEEAWGQITTERRQQRQARTATRRAARRAAPVPPPGLPPPPDPLQWVDDRLPSEPPPLPPSRPKLVINGRPTAAHPWKQRRCLPGSGVALPTTPKT